MGKKHYGEPEQIARIKKEIEDTERMLSSSDEGRVGDVGYFEHAAKHLDVDEVRKSLAMKKRMLSNMTPAKLTGPKANQAYQMAKKLKEQIIANIPRERFVSYPREKDPSSKVTEFEQVVKRQVEWMQSGGDKKIQMYNQLMKRIDPHHGYEDFNRYVKERA